MNENNDNWEEAFDTLDKRTFSVDAIGGYAFSDIMEKYCSKESNILDYGCGKGQLIQKLQDEGYKNIVGTDPSKNLLEQSGLGSDIVKLLENNRIPFPDNYFDFSYCSGVLHHIGWSHLPIVLKELSRVLKPGGIFTYVEPRNSYARQLGHVAVLSPFSKLWSNADALAKCLRAEWPTYKPWLMKEKEEFIPMCEKNSFSHVETKNKVFTVIGVIKNEK